MGFRYSDKELKKCGEKLGIPEWGDTDLRFRKIYGLEGKGREDNNNCEQKYPYKRVKRKKIN